MIVAVAVVSAAGAVSGPAHPRLAYPALAGAFGLTFAVSLVIANVLNRRRPHTLDLVPDGFATPRLGSGPLMLSSLMPVLGVAAAVGSGEITAGRDRWPWILGLLAGAGLLAGYLRLAWVGHGVRLTRDGLTADGPTGSIRVPWAALDAAARIVPAQPPVSPPQPPPPAKLPAFARLIGEPDRSPPPPPSPPRPAVVGRPEEFALRLSYGRPDLVQRRGWTGDVRRISFEGTADDFLLGVIRHYLAHPEARPAIGTAPELARLRAALPAPPPPDPADRPVLEPGVTRTGVALRIVVIVAGFAVSGTDQVPGWLRWTAHAVALLTAWNLAAGLHPLVWLRRVTRR